MSTNVIEKPRAREAVPSSGSSITPVRKPAKAPANAFQMEEEPTNKMGGIPQDLPLPKAPVAKAKFTFDDLSGASDTDTGTPVEVGIRDNKGVIRDIAGCEVVREASVEASHQVERTYENVIEKPFWGSTTDALKRLQGKNSFIMTEKNSDGRRQLVQRLDEEGAYREGQYAYNPDGSFQEGRLVDYDKAGQVKAYYQMLKTDTGFQYLETDAQGKLLEKGQNGAWGQQQMLTATQNLQGAKYNAPATASQPASGDAALSLNHRIGSARAWQATAPKSVL